MTGLPGVPSIRQNKTFRKVKTDWSFVETSAILSWAYPTLKTLGSLPVDREWKGLQSLSGKRKSIASPRTHSLSIRDGRHTSSQSCANRVKFIQRSRYLSSICQRQKKEHWALLFSSSDPCHPDYFLQKRGHTWMSPFFIQMAGCRCVIELCCVVLFLSRTRIVRTLLIAGAGVVQARGLLLLAQRFNCRLLKAMDYAPKQHVLALQTCKKITACSFYPFR